VLCRYRALLLSAVHGVGFPLPEVWQLADTAGRVTVLQMKKYMVFIFRKRKRIITELERQYG
jgi:hypothetical protein